MRREIGVAALIASSWGCVEAQIPPAQHDAQVADLRALEDWVAAEASFSPDGRDVALAAIADLVSGPPAISTVDFYLQVASIVGLADNGHSNVSTGPIYEAGLVPIRTYWFSDGLYVVRARTDLADLIGARITAIGGVPVDRVLARLDPYHGGTEGYFRSYFSSPYMLSPPVLKAAGITDDEEAVDFDFVMSDGRSTNRTLQLEPPGQAPGRSTPWVRLLPTELPGENGRWVNAWPTGSEPGLAFQDTGRAFRYQMLPGDVAYIQLRSNIDRGGVRIRDFANETRTSLEAERPAAIILDNRFNPGGDLTRTADLALSLPELTDGPILVLTSNATFSAGIYTSFFPKAVAPERTRIVGEHVGDRERFWAESRGAFVLPNSGLRIGQSLQMHDIGAGCPEPQICHLAGRERMDIAIGSLEPDIHIPTTWDDFASGRDPVLDWALAEARR